MKALLLTNEFPPHIYGGAGVHVDYLTRELSKLCDVDVRCFGDQDTTESRMSVRGVGLDQSGWTAPKKLNGVLGALQRSIDFNKLDVDANVVHVHTWYSHFAGILAKLNYGIPLILTVHSLEPLRPWKREQLGGGYDFTLWLEKTAIEMADAVIAVSQETRDDILNHFDLQHGKINVIYNGIDTEEYQKVENPEAIRRFGIDTDKPYILFVGRITRQKGIVHLVNAIKYLDPGFQIVLCAGAPDTEEIAAEMKAAVETARAAHDGIIWIEEMVETPTKVALYSHAELFCCPSIYEPFGIINLEAMACETAVVASAVGGMKEVIVHEETGLLVPLEQQTESPFEPENPDRFARDLAGAINKLMADPEQRALMAEAGRHRAIETFSWSSIAHQTLTLYQRLVF